jgi:hypothetical protein
MNFKREVIRKYLQRVTMLVASGAFVAGASLAMGGAGAAQASQPNSDWNEIIAKFDNISSNVLCLDSPNSQLVQLWHCHASNSAGILQRWQFTYEPQVSIAWGEPVYSVEDLYTQSCLRANSLASGQAVVEGLCNNSFVVADLAPGTNPLLGLSALGTNLCLEPVNFSDSNGTRLVWNTCNPNDIQQVFSFLQ